MQYLGKEEIDAKTFTKDRETFLGFCQNYKLLQDRQAAFFTHRVDNQEHMMQIVEVAKYVRSPQEWKYLALSLEETHHTWFLYELAIKKALKDVEILVDVWGIEFSSRDWAVKLQCPDCGVEDFFDVNFYIK